MKSLSLEKRANLEGGRKFWGWDCGPSWYVGNSCYQTCTHYVFWIGNGSAIHGC